MKSYFAVLFLTLFFIGCIKAPVSNESSPVLNTSDQTQLEPQVPPVESDVSAPPEVIAPVASPAAVNVTYMQMVSVYAGGLGLVVTPAKERFVQRNESVIVTLRNNGLKPLYVVDNKQCEYKYHVVKNSSGSLLNASPVSTSCFIREAIRVLATHEVTLELWNGEYYQQPGSPAVLAPLGEYVIVLPRITLKEVTETEHNSLYYLPDDQFVPVSITVRVYPDAP